MKWIQIFDEMTLISYFSKSYGRKESVMRGSMWDISTSGMNILIRDSASLVPDKNIHPSGEISLSHMATHDGFY